MLCRCRSVVDCYDTNRLQHASLDPIVKKAAGGKGSASRRNSDHKGREADRAVRWFRSASLLSRRRRRGFNVPASYYYSTDVTSLETAARNTGRQLLLSPWHTSSKAGLGIMAAEEPNTMGRKAPNTRCRVSHRQPYYTMSYHSPWEHERASTRWGVAC